MKETKIIKPKIIIYDDNDMNYIVGNIGIVDIEPDVMSVTTCIDTYEQKIPNLTTHVEFTMSNCEEFDTIQLDPTLMKRIAKFNKEQECKRLDDVINQKKDIIDNLNDDIKSLDEVLKDKEKRWEKVKEYIANIYEIPIDDDDDDDDDDEYYDDDDYYDED